MKNKLYNLFISIGEYALYALMFSLAISTSAVEISALFMLICFIGRRIIKPDFGFLMFWPNIFLISFLLFNAISIFNSGPYLNISLNSLFRKWMQYALIFIIVQNSIYDQKIIKRCAFAFLFGASLAIFSGLSQYFFGVEFLRNRHLINASGMAPAMTSSFAHYNGFGGYIVTVLSLVATLLMASDGHFDFRVCGLFVFSLFSVAALFLTFSRGSWLAMIVSLVFMSVISKKHSRYLALFFLIVIILFLCPAIRDRVFYTFHIGGDSKRFEKWLIAGKMIAAHPFLGTGVGTFMANFSKYLPKEAPAYAHNCYLQIWAETGIFSLLSFIAFTASLLYLGVRKFIVSADFLLLGLLGGTAGFLAHSFFDTNLYSLRLAVLFWAWLGLIAARINAFNGVELRAERAKSNDFNKRLQLIYSSVSYGAVQRLRCFAPLMVAYQVILRLPTLCFHWIKYIEEGAEKNKIDFLNKIINKIKYLNMRICYVEQKIWNRLTHWRLTQRLNAHNNYDVWLKNNDIAESERDKQKNTIFKYSPKISVILISQHISEGDFDRFSSSLIKQTYENWELFIINISKKTILHDKTDSLIKDDHRMKECCKPDNVDYIKELQRLGEKCSGEYVLLFNSKDILKENAFYEIVNAMQGGHQYDIIAAGSDIKRRNVKSFKITEGADINYFISSQFFGFWELVFLRKNIFMKMLTAEGDCKNPILFMKQQINCMSGMLKAKYIHKELYFYRPLGGSRYVRLFAGNNSCILKSLSFVSTPLKVLFDARLIYRKITGTERYLSELLDGLVKYVHLANLELEVLAYKPLPKRIVGIKVRYDHANAIKDADVYHRTFQAGDSNAIREMMLSRATVFTMLDLIAYNFENYFLRPEDHRAYCRFNKQAAYLADHIIAISNYSKTSLVKTLDLSQEKISVIYLGVGKTFKDSKERLPPDGFRMKYRLPSKYLLFVGTDYPHKNLINFLYAFEQAKETLSDFKIVIIGMKYFCQSQPQLERMLQDLSDHVIRFEHFPEEDIRMLYKNAWALVYPSLYEGFGLPVIEAMQCGAPVLVSNATSLPEVAGDAGVMIDATDIRQFSDALRKICLDSELRKKLIDRGHKQASAFDWDITAKKTIYCYHETKNRVLQEDPWQRMMKRKKTAFLAGSSQNTVFIVTHVKFYPTSAGNELRIMHLIKYFKKNGYKIALLYCPLDGVVFNKAELKEVRTLVDFVEQVGANERFPGKTNNPAYNFLIDNQEPEIEKWESNEELFCPKGAIIKADEMIKKFNPQIVIAEYIWTTRVLKIAPDTALKIIDLHDKFSDKDIKVCLHGIKDPLALTEAEERIFLNRADVIISIQPEEAESFKKMKISPKVITVGVDFEKKDSLSCVPCGKNIILIVASGNPLNIFSVNKFIKEIWPKIQKRIPDARLRIAGPICKVLLCGVHAGVELVGYVENIADEYSNALVVVNPVVAGTGLKIKSLEALSYGKALLSTPAGVEGLPQRDGELFLIAHEPADFISGIEKLIKNKQLQETLENNARLYSLYDLNHNKVYRELSNILQDHFFDKDKTQESCFHGMAQQHIAD